jgi:DNA-binding protein HU-beta
VNKSELVTRLTARLDGDRKAAIAAVNGVFEEIQQSLARGERVSLLGFGTFDRRERGPRTARNPATGQTIQLGATVAPVFRAGAGLKNLLAETAGTATSTARSAAAQVASAAKAVPSVVPTAIAPAKKAAKKAAGKAPKKAKESSDSAKAAAKPASKPASKSTSKAAKAVTGKGSAKGRGKGAKKG